MSISPELRRRTGRHDTAGGWFGHDGISFQVIQQRGEDRGFVQFDGELPSLDEGS